MESRLAIPKYEGFPGHIFKVQIPDFPIQLFL